MKDMQRKFVTALFCGTIALSGSAHAQIGGAVGGTLGGTLGGTVGAAGASGALGGTFGGASSVGSSLGGSLGAGGGLTASGAVGASAPNAGSLSGSLTGSAQGETGVGLGTDAISGTVAGAGDAAAAAEAAASDTVSGAVSGDSGAGIDASADPSNGAAAVGVDVGTQGSVNADLPINTQTAGNAIAGAATQVTSARNTLADMASANMNLVGQTVVGAEGVVLGTVESVRMNADNSALDGLLLRTSIASEGSAQIVALASDLVALETDASGATTGRLIAQGVTADDLQPATDTSSAVGESSDTVAP